ncbi:unnamed protein product [Urochloa decumbens]|uniref:F-box domain-containing protein n=1 Tax=Urochloa decumbens TaxID=240449 RepID=A0ABC9CXQ6_9POAL
MELDAKGKRARASSSILAGDRLSSLPDCLIHQIMSFMKARQVVQTCVLATRWKNLWRSVPCLNIDRDEFNAQGPGRDLEKERKMFEDFTDHLLIPNNISVALLDTFQLHNSDGYYGQEQAARWIRHSIKYSSHQPGIQRKGLSSSSWRLKRLNLSNIYLDDCFTKHVTSGCPYLEDLELKGCSCAFHGITSHTLKNLILKNCSGLTAITSSTLTSLVIHIHGYTPSLLVITAPAVAYLLLESRSYEGGVSLEEMPSLAKATIHLSGFMESDSEMDQFKLLCRVSNVTRLVLSRFATMVLSEDQVTFPNFRNLRTLVLDKCDLSDNFKTLEHFLKNSPVLENLTLKCCKFSKDLKKKKAKSKRASSSQCLSLVDVRCENLKHTEIIYKDDDVRQLVELLLSISANLPKNNIKLTKVD